MRLGILPTLLGVAQVALAVVYASLAWWLAVLLGWFGVSFVLAGLAYLHLGPRLFGKRPTGKLGLPLALLNLPYLFLSRLIWEGHVRLSRQSPYHEIAPGLFLGRRPRTVQELPPETRYVVDLTCELPGPSRLLTDRTYRLLPTLDASAPPEATFNELVRDITLWLQQEQGPVFIHCAQGYGRSAVTVAAVVIALGIEPTPEAAYQRMKSLRPGVRLSPPQYRLLTKWHETFQQA